jgi:hypothetical protein
MPSKPFGEVSILTLLFQGGEVKGFTRCLQLYFSRDLGSLVPRVSMASGEVLNLVVVRQVEDNQRFNRHNAQDHVRCDDLKPTVQYITIHYNTLHSVAVGCDDLEPTVNTL